MSDNRKSAGGAINFAVANKTTEPRSRLGGAGEIQGLARDYNAGRITTNGSRLGARGWLIGKMLAGGL